MSLRALIADAEPRARQRLRSLLAKEADISLLSECATGTEALREIRRHAPDLVFLEIEMPEIEGIEIVSSLPSAERPLIVFVTNQPKRTLEAFELGAIDYLLKPFKPARFHLAVARARARLRERVGPTRPIESRPPAYLKRLIVRLSEHQLVVPISEIDWMESASNYIVLHRGGEAHVLRDTLSSLEKRLSPVQFLRVGRFAIVNLDRIRKLKPTEAGDHIVVMADGKEIPITCGIREVQARLEGS